MSPRQVNSSDNREICSNSPQSVNVSICSRTEISRMTGVMVPSLQKSNNIARDASRKELREIDNRQKQKSDIKRKHKNEKDKEAGRTFGEYFENKRKTAELVDNARKNKTLSSKSKGVNGDIHTNDIISENEILVERVHRASHNLNDEETQKNLFELQNKMASIYGSSGGCKLPEVSSAATSTLDKGKFASTNTFELSSGTFNSSIRKNAIAGKILTSAFQSSMLGESKTVLRQQLSKLEITLYTATNEVGEGECVSDGGMTGIGDLKEMQNHAVSPIVTPRGGQAPVTLTKTSIQRSFRTAINTDVYDNQLLLEHSQLIAVSNSLIDLTTANHHKYQHDMSEDVFSLNFIDMPSNLDLTTSFGEMVEKQPEPFKGMLQQRVDDLNARRREAELLITLTKKLEREERKVYHLENMAVKAITKKSTLPQPLIALAWALEASGSSSMSNSEVLPNGSF